MALNKALTAAGAEVSAPEADGDLALVRQAQEGDAEAFDQLARKYRERLYAILYNLTANREDAADLTQEVLVKAFRSINRFGGRSSFFTWLYRITVNTAFSYLKRSRRHRFFSFEDLTPEFASDPAIEALTDGSGSDRNLLASELQEKLNEALQKLSPKHRTVVVLFEIEGLSHQEIAEISGTSVGTVRSRLHYAKQQLQGHLQDYLR